MLQWVLQCCPVHPAPQVLLSSKAPPPPIYTPDTSSHLGALYLISFKGAPSLHQIHSYDSLYIQFQFIIPPCVCASIHRENCKECEERLNCVHNEKQWSMCPLKKSTPPTTHAHSSTRQEKLPCSAPPKLVFTSLTHQPLLLQGQCSGCCFFRYYICWNWNMVV